MTKRERDRIRRYWNRPPEPAKCSACGGIVPHENPHLLPMPSAACFPFQNPACPHCGARESIIYTVTIGGESRDAAADINALLDALESQPKSSPSIPRAAQP